MIRSTFVISLCLMISACASSPIERFPNFVQHVKGVKSTTVVLDVLLLSDIAGTDLGFNEKRNSEALINAKLALETELQKLGFESMVVAELPGLFFSRKEKLNYFISSNWKSTGVNYLGPLEQESRSPWITPEIKNYFDTMIIEARQLDFRKSKNVNTPIAHENRTRAQTNKLEDAAQSISFSDSKVPHELIKNSHSNVLLYVRVDGRLQSMAKYLGKGILTGVVSGALTGGLFIVAPGSIITVDMVALNTDTNEIVWHGRSLREGTKSTVPAIESIFKSYPSISGEYKPKAKRKRRPI